jgi:L-asparaginase / beta-aspartyl-peptidase
MIVPAIVVHGGAGALEPGREAGAQSGCAAAARRGLEVLAAGGSALDAVQAAVRALEDDPQFNAGVGSALTRDGTVEVDAAIMDGATLRVGAVGAVRNLRQPIDVARAVLDDGEHVLLVGEGAWAFARERQLAQPVAPEIMITERARARLAAELRRRAAGAGGGGTVGACAIDADGHVAAATSTGGMSGKRPGRVGDTPLPGCGTWADDRGGAASGTGHGELIIRVTLTRQVVDALAAGVPAEAAARRALADLAERVGGEAGVICVDAAGRVGAARTTAAMPHAHATLERPEPVTGV